MSIEQGNRKAIAAILLDILYGDQMCENCNMKNKFKLKINFFHSGSSVLLEKENVNTKLPSFPVAF